MTELKKPICDECLSGDTVKMGFRVTKEGRQQRWLCKHCGHTFVPEDRNDALLKQMNEILETRLAEERAKRER